MTVQSSSLASAIRRPHVVIVGAGFAGITAAQALRSAAVDITVIDRRNFHLFQPLLYQVATAALSPGDIAWPIRSIFAGQENVSVVMMEVDAVDLEARTVTAGTATMPYDYLVVATGATHAYFGNETWARYAPGLKTIEDARALRDRLLSAFELAERSADPEVRTRCLTTVVIGGGATGVELVGAIAELAHRTLKGEFKNIDPSEMRIVLIEAGDRLLPAFPEDLSAKCAKALRAMNVEVLTRTSVTDCTASGVLLGRDHIQAATVVWAAGVKASKAAQWLGVEADKANRVVVRADLSLSGHAEVFVIGDTAAVVSSGTRVPGVAPAAKQMGTYAAKVIVSRLGNEPAPPDFTYKSEGDLAVIGRKSAVVALRRLRLSGFLAWIFWCLVHILFLVGFRSKVSVAFNWTWSFATRQRSARLISDPGQQMVVRQPVVPTTEADTKRPAGAAR